MAVVQSSNGGGVNVRSSKSVSSSRLGTIPEGKQINVVTCDATWATLVYNGTPAFVQRQFIVGEADDYGAGLGENGRALCNADSVNVRSQPTVNSAVNGSKLDKGDSVTAYEYSLLRPRGILAKVMVVLDASLRRCTKCTGLVLRSCDREAGGKLFSTCSVHLLSAVILNEFLTMIFITLMVSLEQKLSLQYASSRQNTVSPMMVLLESEQRKNSGKMKAVRRQF